MSDIAAAAPPSRSTSSGSAERISCHGPAARRPVEKRDDG